jgi:uncharacterized protein (DUF924 family)
MIDEILAFWLADRARPLWFARDAVFDAELRHRFEARVAMAGYGAFDRWLAEPRGALALLLLLDQFPRNIWRGKARAFAFDAKARQVADLALTRGHHRALPRDLRIFVYLPLEHSERLADQQRALALFEATGDPEQIHYARAHHRIVARFGRFPHRNAALGRASTAEEENFLRGPGSSF